MTDIKVQFLAFEGCPLAEAARRALEQALAECEIEDYEEVDLLHPEVSEEARGWGSPTILINGADVSGRPKGDGIGCRIYHEKERVPSSATIVTRINEERAAR